MDRKGLHEMHPTPINPPTRVQLVLNSRSVRGCRRSRRTRCAALDMPNEAAAAAVSVAAAAPADHVLGWAPALALLAASWQAPRVIEFASEFLKPRKCRTCWGSGFTLCEACGARGKRGGTFEGGPLVACAACAGRGRLKCTACDATGLANSWLWKPASDPGWGARGE